MADTTQPPWVLPQGHSFGPMTGDLRYHDARTSLVESRCVTAWQQQYRQRWHFLFPVTGIYDGATQKACVKVQQEAHLPVHGRLDKETYDAVWAVTPPVKGKRVKTGHVEHPPRWSKTTRYWRLNSKRGVRQYEHYWHIKLKNPPVVAGEPAWWPGRPFGPHERGDHVRIVQQLMGLKPTGIFNQDMATRIRGWRSARNLMSAPVVDLDMARILDPGPYPHDDEGQHGEDT